MMPPKANIKPTKTLTQRRNGGDEISAPTPKLTSLSNSNNYPKASPLESIAKGNSDDNSSGSVVKIIIWAVVILTVGIGLALIVRNMTSDKDTKSSETKTSESTNNNTTENNSTNENTNTDTTDNTAEDQTGTEDTNTNTDTDTTNNTDTTDTDTDTDTTDTTTTSKLTNDYSQTAQTLSDGTTGNIITVAGYTYTNYAAYLEYKIKLGTVTTFPGVTASIDETAKTLTLIVSNVKTDKIVGNGKSGTTTFAGHPNASKVDISNSSNKTTFVFTLGKVTDYKINAVKGTDFDSIVVTIKNK